jgi:hypothetical protein
MPEMLTQSVSLFAPAASAVFGASVAAAAGMLLSPLEESVFDSSERMLRPLVSVQGRAVNFAFMDKKRSHAVISGSLFAGDVSGRRVIICRRDPDAGAGPVAMTRVRCKKGARQPPSAARGGLESEFPSFRQTCSHCGRLAAILGAYTPAAGIAMNYRKALLGTVALLVIVHWHGARATARGPCDDSLAQGIPARDAAAPGGRAFAAGLRGLTDDEREAAIRKELLSGNIPGFLRRLVPIRLTSRPVDGPLVNVVICAAPDYLAIGSDEDFLLMPMRLATALSTAVDFGFILPTPRMVDAIYEQAVGHFAPQPLPAGSEMRSTSYSLHHNELVAGQRAALGVSLGDLIAGDKKDLVLTNRLRDHLDRVAIYGWHTANGKPIQPLSTVHGWRYADYSHGTRLVSTKMFVDGRVTSMFAAMADGRLAPILSNEGMIADVIGLIKSLDARAQAVTASIR